MTFTDYLRPLWRFKFVVLLVVVLAAVATYTYTNRQPKVYESAATLYVGQSELQQLLNPAAVLTTRSVADEATLVTTPAVAQAVRAKLKLSAPPDALLGAVQAVPASASDFMTISAQTGNPAYSAELANGFARVYLSLRTHSLVQSATATLIQLQRQLAGTGGGAANQVTRQTLRGQIATLQAGDRQPAFAGAADDPGGGVRIAYLAQAYPQRHLRRRDRARARPDRLLSVRQK